MESVAFVELALKVLACTQKELAERLGVSTTQISKWKKGDHLSEDMETRFRKVTGIRHYDPELILMCGSLENAEKWCRLIEFLAYNAAESAETGYNTIPLKEDNEELAISIFRILKEMGVSIPQSFPTELDVVYELDDEDYNASKFEIIYENPISEVISKIFLSFNDVYGFYVAYIEDITMNESIGIDYDIASEIEYNLLSLAACKVDCDDEITYNYGKFKRTVSMQYECWINYVKECAFRAGVPLGAELHNLIYSSSDALGCEAEAESLGINRSRLHPDVYMNELLVGMRMIHQVLPAIMKKLDISE
ncbi:helix-turn-helix transcriptional regulator [Pantoea coffeiphila]|uniref:Transcriptional regulator n=1 Tax=Pantoea coffeiphila TaxID=1465635 RepID=A0A2S9IBP1_9GAMM|nr:helix-turn-helix transcriptional regulator [Pantoea coffeiphila]PRD15219.1 transcriptional regulator [Pantoea coffeiphila]